MKKQPTVEHEVEVTMFVSNKTIYDSLRLALAVAIETKRRDPRYTGVLPAWSKLIDAMGKKS